MSLYNRADLEYDLALLDRMEQGLHARIANGETSAMVLNSTVEDTAMREENGKFVEIHVYTPLRDEFDRQRKRCRMRLLNSGRLIRDLRAAERIANARPSQSSLANLAKCRNRVFGAARANNERRKSLGLPKDFGAKADNPERVDAALGRFERQYFDDRKEQRWPIRQAGAWLTGYENWLRWKLEGGEIALSEFESEKARLRDAHL